MKLIVSTYFCDDFLTAINENNGTWKTLKDQALNYIKDNDEELPKLKLDDSVAVLASILQDPSRFQQIKKSIKAKLRRFFDVIMKFMFSKEVIEDARMYVKNLKIVEIDEELNAPIVNIAENSNNNLNCIGTNQVSNNTNNQEQSSNNTDDEGCLNQSSNTNNRNDGCANQSSNHNQNEGMPSNRGNLSSSSSRDTGNKNALVSRDNDYYHNLSFFDDSQSDAITEDNVENDMYDKVFCKLIERVYHDGY